MCSNRQVVIGVKATAFDLHVLRTVYSTNKLLESCKWYMKLLFPIYAQLTKLLFSYVYYVIMITSHDFYVY